MVFICIGVFPVKTYKYYYNIIQGSLQPGDSVGVPPGAIARAEQLTAGTDPGVLLAQMVAAGQAAFPAAAARHPRWAAAEQLQLLQPVADVQQPACAGTDDRRDLKPLQHFRI